MKMPIVSWPMTPLYQRVFPVSVAAGLMLVLTGCNNCIDASGSNTCLKDHCGGCATADGCLEKPDAWKPDGWKPDGDCCAMPGAAGCADGSTFTTGGKCHSVGAKNGFIYEYYTTCCQKIQDDPFEASYCHPPRSPRGWILALGFFFGFGFCFACCFGCASDEPVKTHLGEGTKVKVWLGVFAVCAVTAGLFHGVLKPMSQTAKASNDEPGLLDLMGGIGDIVGFVLGLGLCIWFKPWLGKKLAARGSIAVVGATVVEATPPQQAVVVGVPDQVQPVNETKTAQAKDEDNPDLENNVAEQETITTAAAGALATAAAPVSERPLVDMVECFKKDLGLEGGLQEVIGAACAVLLVDTCNLSLKQQADKCYVALYGEKSQDRIVPPSTTPSLKESE